MAVFNAPFTPPGVGNSSTPPFGTNRGGVEQPKPNNTANTTPQSQTPPLAASGATTGQAGGVSRAQIEEVVNYLAAKLDAAQAENRAAAIQGFNPATMRLFADLSIARNGLDTVAQLVTNGVIA